MKIETEKTADSSMVTPLPTRSMDAPPAAIEQFSRVLVSEM